MGIWTKNIGELTGLDINLNYVFPVSIEVDTPPRPEIGQRALVEGAYRRIILSGRTLNPQQVMRSDFAVRVPNRLPQFEVRVTATLRDAVEQDTVLTCASLASPAGQYEPHFRAIFARYSRDLALAGICKEKFS